MSRKEPKENVRTILSWFETANNNYGLMKQKNLTGKDGVLTKGVEFGKSIANTKFLNRILSF